VNHAHASCPGKSLPPLPLWALLAILLALGGPSPAFCDEVQLQQNEKATANFAFATQLGSGIYTVNGRTIQVYRIPLAYDARPEVAARWGLRVTYPMTVGLYDFHAADVLENGLPDHMDTVSIVPGVEFRIPLLPRWLLKPYAEAGIGQERTGGANVRIGGAGVRSLADFHPGDFDLSLGNSLVYARVAPTADTPSNDLLLFETSLEARHELGWFRGRRTEIAPYATVDFQRESAGYPAASDVPPAILRQYEVGISYGPREEVRLWRIPIPHIGIGWRFGQDLSAFHLVIGISSRSLER
jgi:hypothetical protein